MLLTCLASAALSGLCFILQEAAIYLQEGENNDKFYTHPRSHDALPAYQIAHNRLFHTLDLCAAILIMLLAACERPAVDFLKLPVGVSVTCTLS